jgi:hypothetical protein
MKVVVVGLEILLRIRGVPVSNLDHKPAFLIEIFREFPKFFQENAVTMPHIRI